MNWSFPSINEIKKGLPKGWKNSLATHLSLIAGFLLVLCFLFSPVLEGKVIDMPDIEKNRGVTLETEQELEKSGHQLLWTSRMFGGMPAYQVSMVYHGNWFSNINRAVNRSMPHPLPHLFMVFLGMYFLLFTLRVPPLICLSGAAAFALCSFMIISTVAGHSSKINAIAWMPFVIAGVLLISRKKYFLGAAIVAFFFGLQVAANHLQITYYLLLTIAAFGINKAVIIFRNKKYPELAKFAGIVTLALLFGIAPNFGRIWTTMEYTPESTRGKHILKQDGELPKSGLHRDYALHYSNSFTELLSGVVPDIMGGATAKGLGEKSNSYQALIKKYNPAATRAALSRYPMYWGDQPVMEGPVYYGVIVVWLMIMGLFLVDKKYRWWLFGLGMVALLLTLGSNLGWFTDLFIKWVPGYSRFRSVTMVSTLIAFAFSLLGALALKEFFGKALESQKARLAKAFKISLAILGGILILTLLFMLTGMIGFEGKLDEYRLVDKLSKGNYAFDKATVDNFLKALAADRREMGLLDSLRSLGFLLAAAVPFWLYLKSKIKAQAAIGIIAALLILDLGSMNHRYLPARKFVADRDFKEKLSPSVANRHILEENDHDYFRVLHTNNPFVEAHTAAHHRAIGGYHSAKLRRFDDLINRYLMRNLDQLNEHLAWDSSTVKTTRELTATMPVLRMLNVRYLIWSNKEKPVMIRSGTGFAWAVEDIKTVATDEEEITALGRIDPAKTAVVHQDFSQALNGLPKKMGGKFRIGVISYRGDSMNYRYESQNERLVVFSENFYPESKGLHAYIDGERTSFLRANYALRALRVPAGVHDVSFVFEPRSYVAGEMISGIGSFALILFFFAAIGFSFIKAFRHEPPPNELERNDV